MTAIDRDDPPVHDELPTLGYSYDPRGSLPSCDGAEHAAGTI